ncbi:DUF2059 domain-containing protein [Roseobacter denitrificans]|uniref:DUF2059 domain-containing protein n=1 Tax=Roseobacter denitrificans (strain ATCC 33942 / OCh 114) TaxID=375451 RepID=Q165Y0_ROSDO|nr:DUF2059 domain-containing protein [Roseobacter denitrificans]ABG32213.1 hypothetical protein RD1_2668 [Roseobacter denitrificans OCh 114]AVL51709.1 DUF2059 domain-containing protein [Roseobacter denitrificans]SFF78779.1 hypothetical protein SAMN05443635_102176 [Roseobacter denitrificans OCh 114]
MTSMIRAGVLVLTLCAAAITIAKPSQAQNTDRLEAFLSATGFDVALESMKLTASSAPAMIGLEAEDFGQQWTRLVDEIFDAQTMHDMAIDILSQTLEEDLMIHAVDFYTSDLGTRLLVVENASHMKEDDELKSESGQAIIAGLVQIGSPRLQELKRLNEAVGSEDASVHAIQEVQVRFLMAAAAAGVIELRMDEADLRENLRRQEGEMRRNMKVNSLAASAYTYQAFSDDEISAYADALEHPKMQKVYALMNAVQFEIMADRYEQMALAMSELRPTQEL